MSSQRQEAFKRGILAFRANSFVDAVRHFDQALDQAANEVPLQIKILDSRAATKAKLQDFKAALADAKRIIDLCPEISKVSKNIFKDRVHDLRACHPMLKQWSRP